jgi:hypothetical protein
MRTARITSLALLLALGQQAFANPCPPGNPPTNCAPPSGPVILDLAGQAVPHGFQQYTASFLAGVTTTQISFAFREDPAFLELDNVSVTTGGGPNLLTNGNFEGGGVLEGGVLVPTGWTALNAFGASAAGHLRSGCGVGSSACWYDGSVQGYDGLNQSIATAVGTSYDVTFSLNDNGELSTFQHLSTNGDTSSSEGNGIDLLLYAGAGIPTEGSPSSVGVPEPATLALFAAGLAGLGFSRRRPARA